MAWQAVDTMSLRYEFVKLALKEGANIRELCRRYEISPKTGYKWLHRFVGAGREGLSDQSRRPRSSPGWTPAVMESAVLRVRDEHPAWGGRKIRHRLLALGHQGVVAASTITEILRRHGR